jgi:hypothetical protein
MRQSLNSRSKSVRSSSTAARFYYVRSEVAAETRLSIFDQSELATPGQTSRLGHLSSFCDGELAQEDRAFNIVDEIRPPPHLIPTAIAQICSRRTFKADR